MASLAQYTISKAVELMKSSRSLCKDGNLGLPKVVSNSITVLESLPDSERSIKNIELFNESLQTTNLGLDWSIKKIHLNSQIAASSLNQSQEEASGQ